MKPVRKVTSSRRKQRKAYFTAPSHIRRKFMSSHLSKDLREKYGVRALPIRKDDEVRIMCGKHKNTTGKVINVYRKKYVIHIERLQKEKANGQPVPIGIHPSNVCITSLKLLRDRKDLIARKAAGRVKEDKDKIQETEVMEID
eukprot:gnl/Trimastix_PCT/35.p1 GENE.gnl/Trimastix_PCT/35~~gnl/Trimastix_PCT/35.p1  ORF type:complete len:165 (+),score=38.13 gnl/Trimastix_PCT/35:67-495(+)